MKLKLLLLFMFPVFAFAQITPQFRDAGSGNMRYTWTGKIPSGYDTLWNAQTIRANKTTFQNGITETSGIARLGGALSQPLTIISGATNTLIFNTKAIGMVYGDLSGDFSTIGTDNNATSIFTIRGGKATGINMQQSDAKLILIDSINRIGASYAGKYNFTLPRQIVDKEYVDSVSTTSTPADSALRKNKNLYDVPDKEIARNNLQLGILDKPKFSGDTINNVSGQPITLYTSGLYPGQGVVVGGQGNFEANVAYNMNYNAPGKVGVHQAFDNTLGAIWYAAGPNRWRQQYAPANVTQTGVGNITFTQGSGYTDGTYDLLATGGTGSGEHLQFTISGGVVTTCRASHVGSGYTIGDVLTIPGGIGAGTGFTATATTLYTDIWYASRQKIFIQGDIPTNTVQINTTGNYKPVAGAGLQVSRDAINPYASISGTTDGRGLWLSGHPTPATSAAIYLNPDNTGPIYVGASGSNIQFGSGTNTLASGFGVYNSWTATSGSAQSIRFRPTAIASANNDILYGSVFDAIYTQGSFTGVMNISAEFRNAPISLPVISNPTNLREGMIWHPGTNLAMYTNSTTYRLVQQTNVTANSGDMLVSDANGKFVPTTSNGTGAPVKTTSAVLVTPKLGAASATSINKVAITNPGTAANLTLANNSTLATSGAFTTTLTSTATTNVTLPISGTLATLAGSESLTNKTLISPILNTTSVVGQVWTATNTTGSGNWSNPAFTEVMTTLGDVDYYNGSGRSRLAGNTTTTRKFLASLGNGTTSAAPTFFDLFNTANTWSVGQQFNGGVVSQLFGLSVTDAPGGFTTTLVQQGTPSSNKLVQIRDLAGTMALTSDLSDAVNTATDANYTITSARQFIKLPIITANRTVSIPTASSYTGGIIRILNQNTSGTFSWSFTGATVKDAAGNNITNLINTSVYIIESDGTNWYKLN